jgi:hypothetical protein
MWLQIVKWLSGGGGALAVTFFAMRIVAPRAPGWVWMLSVLSGFLVGIWGATSAPLQEKIVSDVVRWQNNRNRPVAPEYPLPPVVIDKLPAGAAWVTGPRAHRLSGEAMTLPTTATSTFGLDTCKSLCERTKECVGVDLSEATATCTLYQTIRGTIAIPNYLSATRTRN